MKILLVEDNEDIREGLTSLLESEGYVVVGSATAEEGLACLQREPCQLIITDYMLPGRSGGWLLEQARRERRLEALQAIIITAHPQVSAPAGVRLLHKPLDVDGFLRTVAQALAQARCA